ncbi:MAG: amidohydrolase family protein [Armatimonadota bacterium]|nr:amidohydrolase family protein [Armatimonadota bacterium]
MPTHSSTLDALREFIDRIPLTDTHEHIRSEKDWLKKDTYLGHLFQHYASCDLVTSGMPPEDLASLHDTQLSPEEQWEKFEPYWLKAGNTSYCKAIDIAVRDLFDLPGLNRDTYQDLLRKMEESRKPGWYRKVLKDKANIEVCVLNTGEIDADRTLFAPVGGFDNFVSATTRQGATALGANVDVNVYSMDDFLTALDKAFEKAVNAGIVGVKSGLAYSRAIFYDNTTRHEAEILFNRMLRYRGNGVSWEDAKPFQDFMMHQVIQRAAEYGLPMQFHTGIQEGNGNFLADTNPVLLNNLFFTYRNVKFDVFHAGFPYSRELGVLAKNFANVYPDMCWMHIIGAKSAREILDEWLDLVPANKILGFGGDYIFVEGVYGHAKIARDNVARVLADRVERGDQTMDEAKEIAERILRLNGRELFKLDEKGLPAKD